MFALGEHFVVDLKIGGMSYSGGESRLQMLRVYENLTHLCPTAEITLDDRQNILAELLPFTGREEIEIGFGRSIDDLVYHTFQVFKSPARLRTNSHLFNMILVSKSGQQLLSPRRFKSYEDSLISDVVTEIADDIGVDDAEIELTDTSRNWFCPGWAYGPFLRWLAARARSNTYDTTGFLYYIDLLNRLNFYSIDYALKRIQKKTVTVTPLIEEGEEDQLLYSADLRHAPGTFVMMGGRGETAGYYNWSTGQFLTESKTILQTKHAALCDFIGIENSEIDANTLVINGGVIHGSNEQDLVENLVESDIMYLVNSILRLDILVEGNLDLKVGQRISVELPSAYREGIVNQISSGSWVVERITHQLLPKFVSRLLVSRSGVNAAEGQDLVVPPGGTVQ